MKSLIPIICIVTLLSNFMYMSYSSSSKRNIRNIENLFTYKTPDGTIWINKDREALQRMRKHYIEGSIVSVNKLEAEKQRVIPYRLLKPELQQALASSYSLMTETKRNTQIWNNKPLNFIIFNSLIIVSGFSFLYFVTLIQPATTRRETRKTQSMVYPTDVKHELIHKKNTKDSVPPPCNATSNNSHLLHSHLQQIRCGEKVKDIVCEILQIINKFSDNCVVAKSSNLENFTTDQVKRIKTSSTMDELIAIESEINEKIPSHFKTTRDLIKAKFEELKALINDFAEDFESITRDNTNFSGQIKNSVSHIEKAIELDEIKEIRKSITKETGILRKTIIRKQKKDAEMIKMLSHKVITMNEELNSAKEETMIDSLTRLYNRKAFDRKLRDAFENSSMPEKAFTLIIADIDYFKKINDEYGHIIGDEALKKVANVIKNTFRLNDFMARYGGEEFVIMINTIDEQYIQNICERFRSEIEAINFKIGDKVIPISISLGVAFYKKSDTPETLLSRADKALYLAKQSGRNTIKTEEQLGVISV